MPVIMYKGIPYGEGTNTLDGLKDVDISNPSTGDVVKYNSSTGKFENGQIALSALSIFFSRSFTYSSRIATGSILIKNPVIFLMMIK